MNIVGTYTPSAEETFDSVALHLYGDERYAHLLYLANPEMVHLPRFAGNETLQVPETENQDASGMPPWKEVG